MEGCAAPTVRHHLISFGLKPGAQPQAVQPILLRPYDNMRLEYHLWEHCHLGKMRKVGLEKEGLPEWSTPICVVDQDAKRLLGARG